jgi:16S rRNA (cytosine967-C5)-methyltransferase
MKPGARLQAAIEITDLILQSVEEGGAAADQIVRQYFSRRRYAGSKDRRSVRETTYLVLRNRGVIAVLLGQGDIPLAGRSAVIVTTILKQDGETDNLPELFSGEKYCAEALSDEELALIEQVKAGFAGELPDWANNNYPEWMDESLKRRFGENLEEAMASFSERATLDLRVNSLRGSLEDASALLPYATQTPFATNGLRIEEDNNIQSAPVYRDGLVDIQDEGSQLAVLVCAPQPGMTVLDYCAGAGGKALAMSAMMQNEGSIFAHDSAPARLERIAPRAKRLNCTNINIINKLERILKDMDRVVLDVPCSGTGTWRRNPELRWRLTQDRLDDYIKIQREILADGATRVAVGGQLVYITCSVLPQEDEDQITAFLAEHEEFSLVSYQDNLAEQVTMMPETLSSIPECLLLAPHRHATDGFFVAVMQRVN